MGFGKISSKQQEILEYIKEEILKRAKQKGIRLSFLTDYTTRPEKYQNTMRYILEFFCPIRYKDASGVKIYTPISKTLQKAPAKNSNQN